MIRLVSGYVSFRAPGFPRASSHPVQPGQFIVGICNLSISEAMLSRSASSHECRQMMTPLIFRLRSIARAVTTFVAVISSNPAAYNNPCVAQRSAVRFVIARTFLEVVKEEP